MLEANPPKIPEEGKITPQDELLLLLISPEIDVRRIGNLFKYKIDWEIFLQIALNHRVAPLVFYHLQALSLLTEIPPNIAKVLHNSYLHTLKRNIDYYSELTNILRALKREEPIDVILLKGPAFAETVYGNIGARGFNDIDLLLRNEDIERAQTILSASGYSLNTGFRPERYYHEYHFHLPYSRKTKEAVFNIELHWNLYAPRWPIRINMEGFWLEAIPLTINDTHLKSLSWNHNLLYLSWHNAISSFRELLGLCDMARIIYRFETEVSYDFILDEAVRTNLKIPVYYSFYLIQKLFGIPADIDIKRIEPQKKETRFLNSLFTKEHILQQYVESDWIIMALVRLFLFKGFKYRANCLLDYLFPRGEYLNRFDFENPETVTFFKRVRFCFDGLKVFIHMVWFLISPRSLETLRTFKGSRKYRRRTI
jgi:hypothetical protein